MSDLYVDLGEYVVFFDIYKCDRGRCVAGAILTTSLDDLSSIGMDISAISLWGMSIPHRGLFVKMVTGK